MSGHKEDAPVLGSGSEQLTSEQGSTSRCLGLFRDVPNGVGHF